MASSNPGSVHIRRIHIRALPYVIGETMMVSQINPFSNQSSCSIRLHTLVLKINNVIPNGKNASVIFDFQKYMQEKGSSENHQVRLPDRQYNCRV